MSWAIMIEDHHGGETILSTYCDQIDAHRDFRYYQEEYPDYIMWITEEFDEE